MNITIGIDPSLTNTGIAFSEMKPENEKSRMFTHTIKPKIKGSERLYEIFITFTGLLHKFKKDYPEGNIHLAAIEGYDYKGQNLAELGEASGVLKCACAIHSIPIIVVPPASLKKFATGYSQASKKAMMQEYPSENEHVADAWALADLASHYLHSTSQKRHQLEVLKVLREGKKQKKGITVTKIHPILT